MKRSNVIISSSVVTGLLYTTPQSFILYTQCTFMADVEIDGAL